MLANWKEKQIKKIMEYQKDSVTELRELIGDEDPSTLFYVLADVFGYLLNNDPFISINEKSVKKRELANKIIKLFGPLFLKNKQEIVINKYKEKDGPVIYAMNHGFKDDLLSTVLAIDENAYLMLASLPQFYNTIDGVLSWINGVILLNRESKNSKNAAVSKSLRTLDMNVSEIMCPEGVWNKSPNALILPLWKGIYKIAKESGCKVVPVIHYISDPLDYSKDNKIYTIIDNPIDLTKMDEEVAINYLRNILASNYYFLMEKYGVKGREEVLNGFDTSFEAWEDFLKKNTAVPDRYNYKIETSADYVPKHHLVFSDDKTPLEEVKVKKPIFDENALKLVLKKLQYSMDDIDKLNLKDLEKYYELLYYEERLKKEGEALLKPSTTMIDAWDNIAKLDINSSNCKEVVHARKLVKEERLNTFQRRF